METLNTDTEPQPAALETAATEPETATPPHEEAAAAAVAAAPAETEPAPVLSETPPAAPAGEPAVPTTAAPLPDPAAQPPAPQAESENEAARRKQFYWNRVLTGDVETVPADVRERSGFAKGPDPVPLRGYRMLGTINRSWAADHLGMTKEQVSGNWESLRAGMAHELGVESNENEVFDALSRRAKEEDTERRGREIYEKFYTAALLDDANVQLPAEGTPERRVADAAAEAGAAAREEQLPMADHLLVIMKEMAHGEDADPRFGRMFGAVPWLFRAADAIAEMEEDERARLYAVLQSRLKELSTSLRTEPVWAGVVRAAMRGGGNVAGGMVQALGNAGAGALQFAGEKLGWEGGTDAAVWTDKRLRVLEELRQIGQQGAFPIALHGDWGMGGRILLSTAEAAPSVALSLCGGVGAAVAGSVAVGDTIAEARSLCPQGKLSTQAFAGLLGWYVQENMDALLKEYGKSVFQLALKRVAKVNPTVFGRSVMRLEDHLKPTGEFLHQMAMAPAGQLVNMSTQETAARLNGVASNIDWQSFGDNVVDLETNLKNAAIQLPLILLASGRVKLHHFKNPRAVLGDGAMLHLWGLEEETVNRIMAEQDTVKRGQLLRQELAASRRWSSPSFFPEIMRAMKLLHTEDYQAFNDPATVRDFLELPYLLDDVPVPPAETDAAALKKKHAPESTLPASPELLPALQKMEEWAQHAAPQQEKPLPAALQGRAPRYLTRERRLARRIESRHALRELNRHSYRLLLNRYSLETLLPMAGDWQKPEQVRRELLTHVARSVVESSRGLPVEQSVDIFAKYLEQLYENERDTPYSPDWLRRTETGWIHKSLQDALHPLAGRKRREQPRVKELQSITADLQDSVQDLLHLLPQTDDFQSVLSRCGSVPQAFAHLLHRELKLGNTDWMPADLRTLPDKNRLTPETAAAFAHYSELTGVRLEQDTGENGKTYWRVRRPDGAYTPWHESGAAAVNDLVANTELNLLPMPISRRGRNIGSVRLDDSTTFRRHLNAFDHLSRTGADDLLRFWREDATLLTPGVHVRSGSNKQVAAAGQNSVPAAPDTGHMERSRHFVAVDANTLQTPYGVVMARFYARWQRSMRSGLPTTRAAADFLLRQGMLTEKEITKYRVQELLDEEQKQPNAPCTWFAARQNLLASRLTEYSMAMFLNRLARSPHTAEDIPPTAREWFATAPFYAAKLAEGRAESEPKRVYNRRVTVAYRHPDDWMHRINRRAVEDLDQMRGLAARVRAAEQSAESPLHQDPFYSYLEEALVPTRSTRLEQGWSYFFGGAPAVQNADRAVLNVLESPLSGWLHIPNSIRTAMADILPTEPGQPHRTAEALRGLRDVLHDHPQLNEYALDLDGKRLLHLELDAPDPYADGTLDETTLPRSLSKPYRPSPVLKAGRVTQLPELPPELAADARVMPALRLMQRLRLYAVSQPMETEQGILWRGTLYGGAEGRHPHSGQEAVDWKYRPPLDGLRTMLNTVKEVQDDGGSISVGGVELRGLDRAVGDAWLNHVSVYRYERSAEREKQLRQEHAREHPMTYALSMVDEYGKMTSILRLMPGERESANDLLRIPYVVHAESGLPFTRRAIWRGSEQNGEIYQPLSGFSSTLDRNRSGDLAERLSRRFVSDNVEELLRRTESADALESGRYAEVSNRELLMQLAEDTQFSYTLENREPEELSPGEARWVRLFGSLLQYEYGGGAAAAEQVVQDAAALRRDPAARKAALKTLLTARHGSVDRKKRTWQGRNVRRGARQEAERELLPPVDKNHPLYDDYKLGR